jgi:hypothetical protein
MNETQPSRSQQQVVRAHCQANVKSKTDPDDLDVCGQPATEAVVQHNDYVPVCAHHAMIARRNHWAVGHLRPNNALQRPAKMNATIATVTRLAGSLRGIVIWLAAKLHRHDWECVGRYPSAPEHIGFFNTTYQFRCRSCPKWKHETR